MVVEVRVFGAVELVDGERVIRLAPTERTLLAALAARVGERVSVDVLEEALWPSEPPPSARKSLQGHVARLRRALGATSIAERSGGYRLDPDRVEVDAVRVASLVSEARAAVELTGALSDAIALLGQAKDSFRGEPYADVPESALPAGEVHRLLELQAAVVEEAVEAELATRCGRSMHRRTGSLVGAQPVPRAGLGSVDAGALSGRPLGRRSRGLRPGAPRVRHGARAWSRVLRCASWSVRS